MKARTWVCRALLGLGAMTAVAGCSSGSDGSGELVGVATLSIAAAPSDVSCIRITVAGTRTVVQNLKVMPGQSTVFPLNGLPVGNDTFTGEGFGGSCPPAAGDVASWASPPTPATVSVNPPVNVLLKMVHNGRSSVDVDFQDDTATCVDMLKDGTETDIDCGGGACAPCAQGQACASGTDCSTGVCNGGLCSSGGCMTNADCPAGSSCDPALQQCVNACPAPLITCGGACVDSTKDMQNCGGCGNVCPAGTGCVNSTCSGMGCAPGQALCGNNVCTNLAIDPGNCGGCGNVCPAGAACSNGTCIGVACMPPQKLCANNVCTNVLNDPNNCGQCGVFCGPGRTCLNGLCNSPNTCLDGMRDNGESGVDCGGPTMCPRCPQQQTCNVSSDCLSQICLFGVCTP